jgi:predicted short-subunit dehydrogenase-like oxidoreductase (DUF2520 family)
VARSSHGNSGGFSFFDGNAMKVSIVGAGLAGRGLGLVLRAAGWTIANVYSRSGARAREASELLGGRATDDLAAAARAAEFVIVAVPDGAIESVAARLEPEAGTVVAHTCGAIGAEVLAAVRRRAAHAGALHPLRSFADPARAARSFAGTACAIDGDPAALEFLRKLVPSIGGVPLEVRGSRKALYHAGAVFASNYVVAAMEAALRLFEAAGIARSAAAGPLAALAEGTLANIRALGVPAALTGPIERGDDGTVARHVQAMRDHMPGLAPSYYALALLTCEVARAKGALDEAGAGRIRAALAAGAAEDRSQ